MCVQDISICESILVLVLLVLLVFVVLLLVLLPLVLLLFLFFLWPPCVADVDIMFLPCDFCFFYSSPNLSGHRLVVYHTSTR